MLSTRYGAVKQQHNIPRLELALFVLFKQEIEKITPQQLFLEKNELKNK